MPKPSGTQTYPERLERFKNLLNQSIELHRANGQCIVERKPSSLARYVLRELDDIQPSHNPHTFRATTA